MISENLETALILEDDVDWDVNVHEIFQELSRQMRRNKLGSHSGGDVRSSATYGEHFKSA